MRNHDHSHPHLTGPLAPKQVQGEPVLLSHSSPLH
uniref:3-phosphoinositide-dependent protein kinase 2 n=1 Tax=Rhizophora mucronata TaxID=61149 RepID=A0A2P2J245_RHIMU